MNIFDDVRAAVSAARNAQAAVDSTTKDMANLIAGRLRRAGVSQATLRALKAELRKYNPHTNRWAD